MRAARFLLEFFALSLIVPADCELLKVFVLQRHGNRAPNIAVSKICPKLAGSAADIESQFGAGPGMITPSGAKHMRVVGKFLYRHYFEKRFHYFRPRFELPPNLTTEQRAGYFNFQATTVARHIESAELLAEELFPKATPPSVIRDDAPDNFLACPPKACNARNQRDVVEWLQTTGKDLYSERKPIVQEMQEICGYKFSSADMDLSAGNPHPPFQDIVDLLKFRSQSNLSLPENVRTILDEGRYIQYEGIQQRLFGTDEKVVYWMGELPERLLEFFSANDDKKFGVYVTSREKLYAAEVFFGFVFNSGGIIPTGAIYPGTALIFELHEVKGEKFVKIGYYYPGGSPTLDPPHRAAFKMVSLPGCDHKNDCGLETFAKQVRKRAKVDGKDFLDICAEKEAGLSDALGPSTRGVVFPLVAISLVVLLGAFALVFLRPKRQADYVTLLGA